ncbi:hypothetical protein OAJ52_02705 [Bacteroidia bacterium]|nr:hypothetical protein [Bacteroidia bacterium]
MRSLIVILFFIGLPFISNAQNKFIITYDKLQDNFNFEKVIYKQGRESTVPIDKPKLSKNDVLIFKTINTNELVFDMDLDFEENDVIDENNLSGQLLNGFSSFSGLLQGNLGAVIEELSSLLYYAPSPLNITRSLEAMSEAELLNASLHKKTLKAYKLAENEMKDLIEFRSNISILSSEDKTLEEIKITLNDFKERFDSKLLIDRFQEIKALIDEIEVDMDSEYTTNEELASEIEVLNTKIDKIEKIFNNPESPITKNTLNDIGNQLEGVDFIIAHKAIVESNRDWDDVGNIEYILSFRRKAEDTPYDYDDDNIQMNRTISLKTDKPKLPKWTTGFAFLRPLVGTSTYRVEEDFFGDSMRITSLNDKSSIFSISTSLVYEFETETPISPNLSIGMAMGISEDRENSISLLLGSGLTFKKFPFISVTGGASFTQLDILKDTYLQNVWQEQSEEIYDDQSLLYERKLKPGYYFGINIHF